jgi:Kef-type K+ transport system membrane component KefB
MAGKHFANDAAVTSTEIFLIAMLLIFVVPFLIWRLGRTEYYAPLVVVQIICGILLGPGVMGAAFPDYYSFVFTPQTISSLNGIAWWAVMVFVWIAGVELDLSEAWQRRRETSITAGLALAVPLIFGSVAAMAMLAYGDGWIGPKGHSWQFVIGIGMSCAVTALPILVLLMEKLEILRQPLGQRILRYASLDDIAIWGVLAIILLDWERIGRQSAFLAAFGIASFLYRRLMPRIAEADRWYAAIIWLIGCGLLADWAGLHYMVGAFLAGAVTEGRWFDQVRMDRFRETVLLAFMPVFFLSTGLRTNWDVGGIAVFAAAGLLLFVSVTGKLAGIHIAGRILKWQPGEAALIGWLLQTKALIMIIFSNILLDKDIISNDAFTALLVMAVGSTMMTIPIVTPKLRQLASIRQKSG